MRVSPKMALLILPKGWLAGQGQKQMCHFCVSCQRIFHLNLFNFFFLLQNFLWVGKKKNKTLWGWQCVSGLSSFVLYVMFCLIGYCLFVVLVVFSACA